MNRFAVLALAGALFVPAIAVAGPAEGSVSATLTIPGISTTGDASSVNIGQFLTVDASTGNVSVKKEFDVGTTLERALGVFTFEAAGATSPLLFNRNTGLYQQATGTVIRWDSYARSDGTFNNTTPVGETSASSFTFVLAANVDPFMTYGLSVRNNTGSTNNYSFTFAESLVPPVNGLYNIYADISGSLVNGVANSALNLGTTAGGTIQKVFLKESAYGGAYSAGVDVGLASLNAGAPAGSTTYFGNGLQNASASGTSGAFTYDSWEFRTNFSLSGGNDVATLSGYAEISPIPELETYAMFLAGLLGMGMMLRRRSNR
jgi:hypothetical protein